jgi:hypothetical protein
MELNLRLSESYGKCQLLVRPLYLQRRAMQPRTDLAGISARVQRCLARAF